MWQVYTIVYLSKKSIYYSCHALPLFNLKTQNLFWFLIANFIGLIGGSNFAE